MKKVSALLLIILLPTLLMAQKNRLLVFRNVTLIDMRSEQPKPNMTVVVSGSRIVEIGKKVKPPKNAEMIDATGKLMIPGLWDMHTHMYNNITRVGTHDKEIKFPLFIANGVTSVRDMFSDAEDIKLARQWNAEIDAGTTIRPRVSVGSTIVDGVPGLSLICLKFWALKMPKKVAPKFVR